MPFVNNDYCTYDPAAYSLARLLEEMDAPLIVHPLLVLFVGGALSGCVGQRVVLTKFSKRGDASVAGAKDRTFVSDAPFGG